MVTRLFSLLLLLVPLESFAVVETVQMVQVTPTIALETTIFKPDGPGPFPLVVINHGKSPMSPKLHDRIRHARLSREFLKRGYAVVLPMRQTFSRSTGYWTETGCNQTLTGFVQSIDIRLTLDFFTKEQWVDRNHILVVGQSFGGMAAIAFSSMSYPGVRGIINFAGGLKFIYGCDDWAERLVDAFGVYGISAQVPTLWFYGSTDSHFGPDLAKKLFESYTAHGAPATFGKIACNYSNDSHGMINWSDGVPCYWPETESFLKSINMPYDDLKSTEPFPEVDK